MNGEEKGGGGATACERKGHPLLAWEEKVNCCKKNIFL